MADRLSNTDQRGGKAMNESEYCADEFTDADLNALADAGEFYLGESGFFLMPTQKEDARAIGGERHPTVHRVGEGGAGEPMDCNFRS